MASDLFYLDTLYKYCVFRTSKIHKRRFVVSVNLFTRPINMNFYNSKTNNTRWNLAGDVNRMNDISYLSKVDKEKFASNKKHLRPLFCVFNSFLWIILTRKVISFWEIN